MANEEAKIILRTEGGEQAHRQVKQASEDLKEFGTETERAGKKSEEATRQVDKKKASIFSLDNLLNRSIATVKSWVTGWLAIEGVGRLIDLFIRRLERLRQAQRDVANEALTMQQVAQGVATQLGLMQFGQQGLNQATKFVTDVAASGGVTPGVARDLIIGADVSLRGQYATDKHETVMRVAPLIGSRQMDAQSAASLFALLDAAGLTQGPPEEMEAGMGKILAGFAGSKSTTAGEFISGVHRGSAGFIGGGGSLDDLLVRFAQARNVRVTEESAADLLRQTVNVLNRPQAGFAKMLEERSGGRFGSMGMGERFALLQEIVGGAQTPESRTALIRTMGSEVGAEIVQMIGPQNVAATAGTAAAVAAAGAETFRSEVEGFKGTAPFAAAQADADRGARRGTETHAIRREVIRERIEARLKEDIAAGRAEGMLIDDRERIVEEEVGAIIEQAAQALDAEGQGQNAALLRGMFRARADELFTPAHEDRITSLGASAQQLLAGEEVPFIVTNPQGGGGVAGKFSQVTIVIHNGPTQQGGTQINQTGQNPFLTPDNRTEFLEAQ